MKSDSESTNIPNESPKSLAIRTLAGGSPMHVQDSIRKYMESLSTRALGCNIEYLNVHLERRHIAGNKPQTLLRVLYHLKDFYETFGTEKDLKQITQRELLAYIENLSSIGLTKWTVESIKRTIKSFFIDLKGEEFASFIKPKQCWSTLKGEDCITRQEIMELIGNAESLRDAAMIALAYDGALRPHELVDLKASDIELATNPPHVYTPEGSKTGRHGIPLTFSAEYVARYLDSNPRLADGYLWSNMNRWYRKPKRIRRDCFADLLKAAAKRAEITKRVYPYLLRHSRLTELSNTMTEQRLKKFARWEPDSPMIRNYVHLSINDLDRAILDTEKKDRTLELILQKIENIEKSIERVK